MAQVPIPAAFAFAQVLPYAPEEVPLMEDLPWGTAFTAVVGATPGIHQNHQHPAPVDDNDKKRTSSDKDRDRDRDEERDMNRDLGGAEASLVTEEQKRTSSPPRRI